MGDGERNRDGDEQEQISSENPADHLSSLITILHYDPSSQVTPGPRVIKTLSVYEASSMDGEVLIIRQLLKTLLTERYLALSCIIWQVILHEYVCS